MEGMLDDCTGGAVCVSVLVLSCVYFVILWVVSWNDSVCLVFILQLCYCLWCCYVYLLLHCHIFKWVVKTSGRIASTMQELMRIVYKQTNLEDCDHHVSIMQGQWWSPRQQVSFANSEYLSPIMNLEIFMRCVLNFSSERAKPDLNHIVSTVVADHCEEKLIICSIGKIMLESINTAPYYHDCLSIP